MAIGFRQRFTCFCTLMAQRVKSELHLSLSSLQTSLMTSLTTSLVTSLANSFVTSFETSLVLLYSVPTDHRGRASTGLPSSLLVPLDVC